MEENQRGRGAQQQGQVVNHATTTRRVEEPNTMVTRTLPIFGHLAFTLFDFGATHFFAFTLFDFGATHFFIYEGFVEFANLEIEPLK